MTRRVKKNGRKALIEKTSDKPIPKFDTINLIMVTLFIGSLSLIVWEIRIYQKTFIPLKIPFLIWLSTGLISTPILRKFLTKYIGTSNSLIQIIYCLVTFGGLIVSAFMFSNYYLADTDTYVINEKIISTGTLGTSKGGCRQPFAIIDHNEHEKQLVFHCDTPVGNFESIKLTISKGLYGFEIVRSFEFNHDKIAAYMWLYGSGLDAKHPSAVATLIELLLAVKL